MLTLLLLILQFKNLSTFKGIFTDYIEEFSKSLNQEFHGLLSQRTPNVSVYDMIGAESSGSGLRKQEGGVFVFYCRLSQDKGER